MPLKTKKTVSHIDRFVLLFGNFLWLILSQTFCFSSLLNNKFDLEKPEALKEERTWFHFTWSKVSKPCP